MIGGREDKEKRGREGVGGDRENNKGWVEEEEGVGKEGPITHSHIRNTYL